jgi:hypothetical protein
LKLKLKKVVRKRITNNEQKTTKAHSYVWISFSRVVLSEQQKMVLIEYVLSVDGGIRVAVDDDRESDREYSADWYYLYEEHYWQELLFSN